MLRAGGGGSGGGGGETTISSPLECVVMIRSMENQRDEHTLKIKNKKENKSNELLSFS